MLMAVVVLLLLQLAGLGYYIATNNRAAPAPELAEPAVSEAVVEVTHPTFGELNVSEPAPHQPGQEIDITIDVTNPGDTNLAYVWQADDGDGNTTEGIYYEMNALQELLYQAIIAYSRQASGNPAAYTPDSYPYFFVDADGDGQVNDSDYDNRYDTWTRRLLKAAYNYQVSQKDPGAYTHNATHILQLLYDPLTGLNGTLKSPANLSGLQRAD
jgi:hypothetical protein